MAYKRISPQPVVEGGTGAVTLTGVLTGNGASAITANAISQFTVLAGAASNAVTNIVGTGTVGQVLTSNGPGTLPTWQTATSTIIKAWALADSSGIVVPQSLNVTSVTKTGTGRYDVVLPPGVVTSTDYGVIGSAVNNATFGVWFTYTITSTTAFSIVVLSQAGAEPASFNFIVTQV